MLIAVARISIILKVGGIVSCSPHAVKSLLLSHVESGHEIHEQIIPREFCIVIVHVYKYDRIRGEVNTFLCN